MPPILRVAFLSSAALLTGAAGWWPFSGASGVNADLREQVCEKLTQMKVIGPVGKRDCLSDDEEFLFAYNTAVEASAPVYMLQWGKESRAIRDFGNIDKSAFKEISYEEFAETFDTGEFTAMLEGSKNAQLDHTYLPISKALTRGAFADIVDIPHLRFSPTSAQYKRRFNPVELPIEPELGSKLDDLMGWQCSFLEDVGEGCSGDIYLIADGDEDDPNLHIAAFDLNPLTENQVKKAMMEIFELSLKDGDYWLERDADRMLRFLTVL